MFEDDKIERKCPNFTKTIMDLNKNLIPNCMFGLKKIVNINVSELFGARPTSTLYTFKSDSNTFCPSDYEYGLSYNNKNDARVTPAHGNATVQASLDVNTRGHFMGNVEYKILDNLMLGAWVKRDFEGKAMASLVEWSSDRYNTNVEISVSNAKTPKTIATFCASQLYRVNSRWSIGDKSVINMDRTSGCWWAEKNAFGYTAALRYDNERHTAAAVVTLDRAANASLLYQRRLDDALTVGAEVTANARDRTTKVTLLHRATLANGLECKGRLDTNGWIVGNVRKVLLSNNNWSLIVGVSASLDYGKKLFHGFGIEAEINIPNGTKEYD